MWQRRVETRQLRAAYRCITHTRAMSDELATVTQARSLLILLLATCQQTLLALEAAANVLDTDLTADLRAMINRSEGELEVMTAKIKELAG